MQNSGGTDTQTPQVMTTPVSKSLAPVKTTNQISPRKVLSSHSERDDEKENDIETLRRKYRKALNPTPIEGVDVGDSEEVLDPQIRIPEQSDFEIPPPLQEIVDPSKITHKFLPKQGDIDRLIKQITKCYHTISQRFYCPNLVENLRAYITGFHVCQMFKKGKNFQRPYQKRMNINTPAMTRISMDIKQMPVNRGYSHILVLLCEVSNYMVALPLTSTRTQNILEAFQRGYLAYFGPPTHIICDQDPAFTSSLMEAFVTQLNIKVILVSPTNHKSLQAEHRIKSLSGLLVKHLSQVWSWHSCLPYSMLCYNGYSTPNLNGYSPYELVFGHRMTLSQELELKVDTVVSGTCTDYHEKLKKNLRYMSERLQKFRSQRLDMLNRNRQSHAFEIGQIVYMYQARGSMVQTGSRKIACYFVGPLVIYKAVGPNQFLLMSLDGQIYPHLIEETRLKPGTIWTSKGNVTTLVELRQALSTGLKIKTK